MLKIASYIKTFEQFQYVENYKLPKYLVWATCLSAHPLTA